MEKHIQGLLEYKRNLKPRDGVRSPGELELLKSDLRVGPGIDGNGVADRLSAPQSWLSFGFPEPESRSSAGVVYGEE